MLRSGQAVVPPQTSVIFNAVTACFPAHRTRPGFDVADVALVDGLFWWLPGVEGPKAALTFLLRFCGKTKMKASGRKK